MQNTNTSAAYADMEHTVPTVAPTHTSESTTETNLRLPTPKLKLTHRAQANILKFSHRLKKRIRKRLKPDRILNLRDAGTFKFKLVRHLARIRSSLKIRLPSAGGETGHFVLVRKQERQVYAKLLSFVEVTQAIEYDDLLELPFCSHIDESALLPVLKKMKRTAQERSELLKSGELVGLQPDITTKVWRCPHCPSEHRLSLSSRRLTAGRRFSSARKREVDDIWWTEEPTRVHFVLERWVDFGRLRSAEEKEWKSLGVERRKVGKNNQVMGRWDWATEEHARVIMDRDEELAVESVAEMWSPEA